MTNLPTSGLKIEFIETQIKCDLLKVTKQFALKGLTLFPFYHIVSDKHLPSHSEHLFLVAEVLDEVAGSYSKYKPKLGYQHLFYLIVYFFQFKILEF